jgi:hypothetical protein
MNSLQEKIGGPEHQIEADLILQCARTAIDTGRVRDLLTSPERKPDWSFILKVAGRNGLLPLVSSNLLRQLPGCLDEDVRSKLSGFLNDHVRNNFYQSTKVIEICELLDSAGIPALAFKGPTLAVQAYGDVSLRHFVDLDLLVQPRHFDEAVTVLRSAGYHPVEKASLLKRKTRFFTRKKDVGLVSEDRRVRIELHWKLSGTHFAMPLEIDQLWKRLDSVTMGGTKLNALPFSDLFAYLCLHGSRHGWGKFLWVADINELINAVEAQGTQIDWHDVRQHARKHGCEKALELGIVLIEKFFGRRMDYPDIERILTDERLTVIARRIGENAFAERDAPMEMSEWYAYHLSLREKMSDRLRTRMVYLIWYLKIAVKPNELDEAVFHLPGMFYPLYYIIRPVRLTLTRRRKVS